MKDKKDRLKKHIESLEKSYNNILEILNENLDKDDNGKIKLKDSQRKVYAEGIDKASQTANDLLEMIDAKSKLLYDLENPEESENGEKIKSNPDKKEESGDYPLEQHLE